MKSESGGALLSDFVGPREEAPVSADMRQSAAARQIDEPEFFGQLKLSDRPFVEINSRDRRDAGGGAT
jgi:hypothetical protein